MAWFSKIFESKEDAERRKRKEARKVERAVERVVDNLADKSRDMERERDKLWNQAKMKLQSGQKAEAAKILKMYKSKDIMINRIDRQKTFVQHQLDMITGARDMQIVTDSLKAMAEGMNFSAEGVEDNLFSIDLATAEVSDINNVLDKAFEKSMSQLDKESEALNSDDNFDTDLMAALENEAVGEITGKSSSAPVNLDAGNSEKQDINAGRDRLKKLLEEK